MTGGHQHQAHKADYVYVLPSDVGHGTAAYPSLSGPGPSADDLEAVRALLLDKWREKVDTATLRRFLVAVGGHDKVAASKRLNTTLAWREQVKPEDMVCTACAKKPESHYMHVVGYDMLRRPIIYSCLELATNRAIEDNQAHMINTFEMAIKCMPEGQDKWVWACDFHGFSVKDVDPRLAKLFLDLSAAHYPERLGRFLLIGAPKLFGALWKVVSPFIDPRTYSKIKFCPFDLDSPNSLLQEELDSLCDPETAAWLSREMQENRHTKTVKTKMGAYSMSHIHSCASKGHLLTPPPLDPATRYQGKNHDLRGTPALLRAFATSPDLLEPQALASAQ